MTTTSTAVLIGAEELAARLADPDVVVVEVDVNSTAFDEWHIDGAEFWNVYTDLKDTDYHTVDSTGLEGLLARSGIGPGSTVVFYGYAPALGFWLLKCYGHADVRILDCSRQAWQAGGHPWGTTRRRRQDRDYRLGEPDPRLRATPAVVSNAIGDPGTTLLDVRSAPEYDGERFWPSGGMDPDGRAGHVPTAVHQPIDGLYDSSGAFLPDDRAAPRVLLGRSRQPRRGHHVLHRRRPRGHRLVRSQPAARPEPRPRLRRLVGRMGTHPRHSRRHELPATNQRSRDA